MLTTTNAATAAAARQPRLFDKLDAASQEKVTMLLSHYQLLLPVEQAAFMQELDRFNEEQAAAAEARGKLGEKWIRYMTPRLQAVQAREQGYVQRVTTDDSAASVAGDEAGADVAATPASPQPPCSIEDLLYTPGMFGEQEGVDIHVGKMSLYEKLHQNMDSRRTTIRAGSATNIASAGARMSNATTATAASATNDEARTPVQYAESVPRAQPQPAVAARTQTIAMSGDLVDSTPAPFDAASTTGSIEGPVAPYRSNAYQAVRLAMSSPGYVATTKPASLAAAQSPLDGVCPILNATGFPISEAELRNWFDSLDVRGRGVLTVEEFQRCMEALERDLGVPTDYATLLRDGEELANNERLSFEAFAYLVLRFVRF